MASETALPKKVADLIDRIASALDAIDRLLLRLGQQGLQRMTKSSVSELQALSQTAHNAKLVSIERQIDTLATHVQRYLDRDPLFTLEAYMSTVNKIWLLNSMARRRREAGELPEEMVDLLGELRRSYELVAEPLVLQPIGASGWVSDTDFVGVTVYFYCEGRDGLLQASNAKPCAYFGRDPRGLLHQSISDYQSYSISSMAHGAFTFHNAKVSRDGRLSLHKDLTIEPAAWFGARAYEALAVRSWSELAERLRASSLHPVGGADTNWVYVEPHGFSEVVVDQKTQRATANAFDAAGSELVLEVALRDENNFLIDNLEHLAGRATDGKPSAKQSARRSKLQPDGLFGRAWVADGQLKLLPHTAIYHTPIQFKRQGDQEVHEVHLSLESLAEVRT